MRGIQQRTWEVLEASSPSDQTGRLVNAVLMLLISLNVVAMVLETVHSYRDTFGSLFWWFEVVSVAVFTVEYLLRVWSCVIRAEHSHPLFGRIRFVLRPMSIIDFLAFAPWYLTLVPVDLRFLRVLRLFRIFRIAKLGRYSSSLRLIGNVFVKKKEELIITAMVMAILVILASSFMYFAEHQAQPEKFSDIPTTMWWAIVTLTTVGYGDVYPITPLGRLFAACIAVMGIGMFALPAGILGASFMEELDQHRVKARVCPHCGKSIDDCV